MATTNLVEANRRNAELSTGPRSAGGKAAASRNALKHGVLSPLPVIPAAERPEDWEAHRAGIVGCLAPAGALEGQLAERVALALWRLNRVARYEAAVIAATQEEAVERLRSAPELAMSYEESVAQRLRKLKEGIADRERWQANSEALRRLLEALPGMPDGAPVGPDDVYALFEEVSHHLPEGVPDFEDDPFPRSLGVPAGEEPWRYGGWTAGMARRGLEALARAGRTTAERLLEKSLAVNRAEIARRRSDLERLSRQAKALRRRGAGAGGAGAVKAVGPGRADGAEGGPVRGAPEPAALPGLHELERLQARRAGQPVVPPLALDVSVKAPEGVAVPVTPPPPTGGR